MNDCNKTKILFLSNHFLTLHSFRKELLEALSGNDYDVYVSTPKDDQNSYFLELGFKVIETKIDRRGVNPIKDLSLIIQYKKIMKLVNPDIVFSYTIKPNIYGSFVSNHLHIKQVCNITGTGGTFLSNNLLSKIARILYRLSVKKSYKVFFQNKGDCKYFINNNMINNNYEIIPGSGVNINQYKVQEFPNDSSISFIFIGRVMKLKGIDEYLEAAKIIKNKYENTNFYIAGWNEENDYISKVKCYEDEGYVKYIGFQKDISKWINKCQCTILPSHGGEGVPNVLLETAASGRVCIASSINGSNDVIDDGVNGYIFEVGDYNSLVNVIEKYIQLSYQDKIQMGLAGRKKIENNFNRKYVVDRYLREVKANE